MTEESNDDSYSQELDQILKCLNDSNFVAIFFLLMDRISPKQYLCIIEQNQNEKISFLKKTLLQYSKGLLIEILWTIKRYDLLKAVHVCRHKYTFQSTLNIMWKSLYEVCESFDIKKDLKYFTKILPGVSISEEDDLEVFIIKAYKDNLVSKDCLSKLLDNLNKDNEKSKTWLLCKDNYFVRQPSIKSPCGLAVIINHEHFNSENNGDLMLERRKYSQLDVDALNKLWKSFGFETQTHLDLKKEKVVSLFKELSEKDLSMYDVFVTCYMSHGKEGVVYSSDCKPIKISCIIDFMANKCKSLVDKPKLFFIQACQGTQIQRGISYPIFSHVSDTDSSSLKYSSDTPLFADVLVVVSTIPGFVSFSTENKNCWFIEALVENLEQYGHLRNILDVVVKVNYSVSNKTGVCNSLGVTITNCKQMAEVKNTFRKNLQLKKLST